MSSNEHAARTPASSRWANLISNFVVSRFRMQLPVNDFPSKNLAKPSAYQTHYKLSNRECAQVTNKVEEARRLISASCHYAEVNAVHDAIAEVAKPEVLQ